MTKEMTAESVVRRINEEITEDTSVELSDEEMVALGIWERGNNGRNINRYGNRRPRVSSANETTPVEYKIYNISDIVNDESDYGEFNWMSLMIHKKQQGPRKTIPYVDGIGEISLESVFDRSYKTAMKQVSDAITKCNENLDPSRKVEVPSETAIKEIVSEIQMIEKDIVKEVLRGDSAYTVAYNGHMIAINPFDNPDVGVEYLYTKFDLSEEQERIIRQELFQSQTIPCVRGSGYFVSSITFTGIEDFQTTNK